MKKKLFVISLLLIILVLSIYTIVLADSTVTTAGIIYRNDLENGNLVDLLPIMTRAYGDRGYATYGKENPEPLVLFSNLVAHNVQLYFCHGGYYKATNTDTNQLYDETNNFIVFSSSEASLTTAPTGNYRLDYDNGISENVYAYSVNNVNMSHARLVTLAACYTAGYNAIDFNSISAKLWMNNADMVVSWYKEVTTPTLISWLEHYHVALGEGKTVSEAMEYANDKWYVPFGNVEDCHLYANNPGALVGSELEEVRALTKDSSVKYEEEKLLEIKNLKNTNSSNIESIIQLSNSNFDENDYLKEEIEGMYVYNEETGAQENVSRYIKYSLKIGDFVTNSGYTVVLDANGNIKKIVDNTISQSETIAEARQLNTQFEISSSESQKYFEQAEANISDKSNIQDEEILYYYDLIENKKYAYVKIRLSDDFSETYVYEM